MKIIPSPPTDNLYKFFAVFGLWLCTIVIVFLGLMTYLAHESLREAKSSEYYRFAKERSAEIARRIKAIDEGRYAEDLATHVPPMPSIKQERVFLETILTNFQETLHASAPVPTKRSADYFDQVDALGGERTVGAFTAVAAGLISVGFIGWYRRVQRPAEQLGATELDVKKTELLLKQTELRHKEVEIKLKEAELRRVERDELADNRRTPEPVPDAPVPLPEPA